ncbi:MAG: hypothetical protein QXV28_07880 [Ignisphaera sp.]
MNSNKLHPIVWIEVVDHALHLYEIGEIEVKQLATVVYYVSKILGLSNISKEVKKNPRKAVRHAIKIIDNYLKADNTRELPVMVSITFNKLVETLRRDAEEEEF